MFITWLLWRYTPKKNNLSQKHRLNHFKNCLWHADPPQIHASKSYYIVLNMNSLAGPTWMYRLSRSFPMRFRRTLRVSWRGTWPESSLTWPGKTQLRATARSPTTNSAQTWETSCRRTWTGSVHRKTERKTTGEWYVLSVTVYKQNINRIRVIVTIHYSFCKTGVGILTLMCITTLR